MPEQFGLWNSVYQGSRRWAKAGEWKTIFNELQEPDLDWLMSDSTTMRAHQHAACQKSDLVECLGQSVDGWMTKIHAGVDALDNPPRIILDVGQKTDIMHVESLLSGHETNAVLANRGFDANELIN